MRRDWQVTEYDLSSNYFVGTDDRETTTFFTRSHLESIFGQQIQYGGEERMIGRRFRKDTDSKGDIIWVAEPETVYTIRTDTSEAW